MRPAKGPAKHGQQAKDPEGPTAAVTPELPAAQPHDRLCAWEQPCSGEVWSLQKLPGL